MDKLTLEQIKDIELDILIMFDKLCKKHNLSYQLAYGTLIGAVRHKGFIPWDDDIDLIMPYEDYMKLCDIVNDMNTQGIIEGHYRVADYHVACEVPYHQPFMKIYDTHTTAQVTSLKPELGFKEGVFIDVFYYNGLPDDPAARKVLLEKANEANTALYYATKKKERWEYNPFNKEFMSLCKSYAHARKKTYREWLACYFDALTQTTDSRSARIAFDVKAYCMCGDMYCMESNLWEPTIDGKFEGHTFPIPAHYDELLTRFYGDYMTPPPIEQQEPSHDQGYYLVS